MPAVRLHEFSAVDQSADRATFVQYLDTVDSSDGLQQLKQRTYALMELQPGHKALDVGCGTGGDVRAMARLIGPTGCAVGIDSSSHLIDIARSRSLASELPGEFYVGQAGQLAFGDGVFDACRAERVLQHVADAGQAIAEMIRVLRPDGRLVCFEPDWDLQVFDAPDRDLTRAICNFRSDRMQSGRVGHQLRGHFIARDLIDVQVVPLAGVITDLKVADAAMGLRGTLEEAVESRVVTKEEAVRWWAGLEETDRAGHFFAASVAFLVSGRKCPASQSQRIA